jgi:uncharacterized iron-regulated membrane protein
MLRRWHKLIAPFFAAFLLLTGGTGVAIQVTDLLDTPIKAERAAGIAAPGAMAETGKPKRTPMGEWNHWLKTLHSGEIVGGGGIAVNLLSGLALAYFAGSGFWMYYVMWRRRRRSA